MKNFIGMGVLACVIFSSSTSLVLAGEKVCEKKSGTVLCKRGKLPSFSATGVINMNETEFEGGLSLRGQVYLNKVKAGKLTIYGDGFLDGVTISSVAKVYGVVSVKKSNFNDALILWSNNSVLESSHIKRVDVFSRKESGCILRLVGSTIIDGDITFKGCVGKVIASPSVKLKGKVISGTYSIGQ